MKAKLVNDALLMAIGSVNQWMDCFGILTEVANMPLIVIENIVGS